MSDEDILRVDTVSIKQFQGIITVLLERKHVILGAHQTLALAVREHVARDDSVTESEQM